MALCSMPNKRRISPKLKSTEVRSDPLVIAVGREHPLAREQQVSVELLAKYPAILPPEASITRRLIDDRLRSNNETAQVAIESSDFETMKTMASIGLGWACFPEYLVNDSLTVLEVENMQLKSSIALVRNHERTLSRAALAFAESCAFQNT